MVIRFDEDVFKSCFEIIKNKVVVKTESVFERLILYTQTFLTQIFLQHSLTIN